MGFWDFAGRLGNKKNGRELSLPSVFFYLPYEPDKIVRIFYPVLTAV